jgi:uncharacterized protein YegJ (DUF2314 family)
MRLSLKKLMPMDHRPTHPSTTFHEISDMYFSEQVGEGRVSELFWLEDVTLEGITQHIGVVNTSSNFGDASTPG